MPDAVHERHLEGERRSPCSDGKIEEDDQPPRRPTSRDAELIPSSVMTLEVGDEGVDESERLPAMALLCPDTEVYHLKEPKWLELERGVDSGAAASVAPKGLAP